MAVWLYAFVSVLLVSIVSFVGIFVLTLREERLKKLLIYLISLSAGALLGDAFLHLLPEIIQENGFQFSISLSLLSGILLFFVLEKFIHWQHCHMPVDKEHPHTFAYMNLVGDGLHNFIDGMIIAVSYIVSIPVGIATTLAVMLHEIPQEIGDFGVLLHGGFSKRRALGINFLTALTAVAGALVALWLSGNVEHLERILVPLAAGGFIYIAGSDLIPELHKETEIARSIGQIISFVLGIALMIILLFVG